MWIFYGGQGADQAPDALHPPGQDLLLEGPAAHWAPDFTQVVQNTISVNYKKYMYVNGFGVSCDLLKYARLKLGCDLCLDMKLDYLLPR